MKDRKDVYAIRVALKNLSDFLSVDFTNNLSGMWNFAKPTDGFAQAPHVRRCSGWRGRVGRATA